VIAIEVISSVANVAAAVGVVVVIWQLRLTRQQLRAGFERTFVDKYERIIGHVPLGMILGEDIDVEQDAEALRAFFDYFELCEEELYYRAVGKVSTRTWREWWEGIALHFRRPAFRQAWEALKDRVVVSSAASATVRVEQFTLLRSAVRAVEDGRAHDPRHR